MLDQLQARVSARALSRTIALGVALAAGMGGAAVAVGVVQDNLSRGRAERFAEAAERGFSDSALRSQSGDASASALAIAARLDGYGATGDDVREAEAALFAERLERSQSAQRLAARIGPAAEPFHGSALSSARELDCLTQAVYFEARGEGTAGQAAVAQVVLNRVRHPAFPKSVCGVVFQGAASRGCQFSFACDGSVRRGHEPAAWRRAQGVAARALSGYVAAEVGAATHFHAARVAPGWNGMVRVAAVGQHVFYRFGGGAGAPSAFPRRARPETEAKTVYASMLPATASALPQILSAADAVSASPAAKPAPKPKEPVVIETPAASSALRADEAPSQAVPAAERAPAA